MQAHTRLGHLLRRRQDVDGAEKAYRAAIAADGAASSEARRWLCYLHIRKCAFSCLWPRRTRSAVAPDKGRDFAKPEECDNTTEDEDKDLDMNVVVAAG